MLPFSPYYLSSVYYFVSAKLHFLLNFPDIFLVFICALSSFVRGIKPGRDTGFDIAEPDLLEMEQCHGVVVASAIFGTPLIRNMCLFVKSSSL